jgi:hypothetical protein
MRPRRPGSSSDNGAAAAGTVREAIWKIEKATNLLKGLVIFAGETLNLIHGDKNFSGITGSRQKQNNRAPRTFTEKVVCHTFNRNSFCFVLYPKEIPAKYDPKGWGESERRTGGRRVGGDSSPSAARAFCRGRLLPSYSQESICFARNFGGTNRVCCEHEQVFSCSCGAAIDSSLIHGLLGSARLVDLFVCWARILLMIFPADCCSHSPFVWYYI